MRGRANRAIAAAGPYPDRGERAADPEWTA